MSVTNADDMAVPSARRISWFEIFCYALPPVGAGYMFCLVTLYTMKFSTDVLLIAPALMGTIYGLSRFWDAISDPLVGYLSDKTKTGMGRRRPWLLERRIADRAFLLDVVSPIRRFERGYVGAVDGGCDYRLLLGADYVHRTAYVAGR